MAYLLDANIFIQAKNLHYGFDFCPAFWDWLIREHRSGTVLSISQVGHELVAGDDELSEWAQQRGHNFFRETDRQTLPALAEVSRWVLEQAFEPAAVNTFMQIADYYLVAYAKAHRHHCDTRSPFRITAQDQGADRMHRHRCTAYDTIRNAAARTRTFCAP